MRTYLLSTERTLAQMTADEAGMYQTEMKRKEQAGKLIADCLVTLERFCASMPLEWIMGRQPDFTAALLHLLREPATQVQAVACLEQLAFRKIDFQQWMRLVSLLPQAVGEANQAAQVEQVQAQTERAVGGNVGSTDPLAMQLDFHRSLSRMLAVLVSAHISHITTDKQIVSFPGMCPVHSPLL